jgi:hypothetical protein
VQLLPGRFDRVDHRDGRASLAASNMWPSVDQFSCPDAWPIAAATSNGFRPSWIRRLAKLWRKS